MALYAPHQIEGHQVNKVQSVKNTTDATHVTHIILESISDGVFTVDHNWRIMSFNRAAESITGIDRKEAVGRHCWDVFRSNMCEGDCALKRTMKEGKSFVSSSTHIIDINRKKIPIAVSTSLLCDENGTVLGGVETFRDLSLVEELRKELNERVQFKDMVSRSPLMQKMFKILPQISQSDATVLIQGETGTGKELLARAVHNLSDRKNKPFKAINCGALPDTLLESELFGYKAGAFTHAVKDKPGLFELAAGGTILLDEIGDISPAFQVRLLRVLEDHKFQPLGGIQTHKADFRIIAATHKDLGDMVKKGLFRQDLFYRINVVNLTLPPLRNRMEDLPLLSEKIIGKLNNLRGRSIGGLEPRAMELMMAHDFPGNIRELENIIERAFVLCRNGLIQSSHLPDFLIEDDVPPESGKSLDVILASAETRAILNALRQNNFSRNAAAKELGLHKSTFFRKIKKLNITIPKTRSPS